MNFPLIFHYVPDFSKCVPSIDFRIEAELAELEQLLEDCESFRLRCEGALPATVGRFMAKGAWQVLYIFFCIIFHGCWNSLRGTVFWWILVDWVSEALPAADSHGSVAQCKMI